MCCTTQCRLIHDWRRPPKVKTKYSSFSYSTVLISNRSLFSDQMPPKKRLVATTGNQNANAIAEPTRRICSHFCVLGLFFQYIVKLFK